MASSRQAYAAHYRTASTHAPRSAPVMIWSTGAARPRPTTASLALPEVGEGVTALGSQRLSKNAVRPATARGHLVTRGGEIVGALRATEPRLPVDLPEALVDRQPYLFVTRVHARQHEGLADEGAGFFSEVRHLLRGRRPWISPLSGAHTTATADSEGGSQAFPPRLNAASLKVSASWPVVSGRCDDHTDSCPVLRHTLPGSRAGWRGFLSHCCHTMPIAAKQENTRHTSLPFATPTALGEARVEPLSTTNRRVSQCGSWNRLLA